METNQNQRLFSENQKSSVRDELCVVVVMLRVDITTPVSEEIVQRLG